MERGDISGSCVVLNCEDLIAAVDRSAAWELLQRRFHPAGICCPSCGAAITGPRALDAWREMRRVYCSSCGHKFSATIGTPIHDTSWQPDDLVRMLLLADAGRSPARIAEVLGKSTACVRDMLDRVALVVGRSTQPDQLGTA